MGKRVRLTNDSLNCYGTRVLTAGMDIRQYERNPVLLYMHERGTVIGYVQDLKIESGELTGELVFDEASELSQRCKKQWNFGSLKMVSIGIDIIETSEDKELLVQGQTAETITKSKLIEVSVVDIGANDDAIVLHRNGEKLLTLGKTAADVLPLLHSNNNNNNPKKSKTMDLEKIALTLGLPKDADEASVDAAIAQLQAKGKEADNLKSINEQLTASRIEEIVDHAVNEKKITAAQKAHFVGLGKKVGIDDLKKTLEAMSPVVKPSDVIRDGNGSCTEYTKLSDVPAEKLAELKEKNPTLYRKLYKAEYGVDF